MMAFAPWGAACQDPLAQPIVVPVPDPSEYRTHADLLYRERDGRRLLMDVFVPLETPDQHAPAVVIVHGGFLPESVMPQGKNTGQMQSFGRFVTEAGLAGVVFSHGLSDVNAFQSAREDVEAAVVYARERAPDLGLDPDRICLVLVSAGGVFLAPFLAARPSWLRCVVLYYTVLRPAVMEELGVGEIGEEQKTGLDPFPHVAPPGDDAPALFIAEAGGDAPALNSDLRLLRDAAVDAGWQVEYWNHPSGPHVFDVCDPSRRSVAILMRTREFLRQQLLG